MRILCTSLVLLGSLLVSAAPAGAGTVSTSGFGGPLTFTAGPGEVNNLTLGLSSGLLHVSDTVPITVAAGDGLCSNISPTVVRCAFNSTNTQIVNLGDMNDTFQGHGPSNRDVSTVDGGPGDDTLTSGSRDTLMGGEGDDFLVGAASLDTLQGGSGTDRLEGNGSFDRLDGGSGNDLLRGGDGDDTLQGGPGSDTYEGGAGNDLLENSADPDGFAGGEGFDTVDYTGSTSFDPRLGLLGVVVTFDEVANDGNRQIDGGFLSFGPADDVRSDVEAVLGTAGLDALDGGAAALDQSFTGAGGDDTITGGPGADTLVGTGDVNWTLTNTSLAGQGTDTFTGIETATLSGGASANTLDASASDRPVSLNGGDGVDTLLGGTANDTLNGGSFVGVQSDALSGGLGDDTLFNGTAVATTDATHPSLVLTPTTLTGLGTDTLSFVTAGRLIGDSGNNTLNASAFTGPVTLEGAAGVDTLRGGSAEDVLTGGAGNDTLDGAGAADRVVESADANFTLNDGTLNSSATGTDSLQSVERATLTGGPGDNSLSAGGFTGTMTLNGGAGADDLVSGATGVGALNGGPGADTLTGGANSDTLNGDEDSDALDGRGGADTLNGGLGDDNLTGGDDTVNDTLVGGGGTDRVVASKDTNFTLLNSTLTGTGNDALSGIQRATISGGGSDNALNASAFTLGGVTLDGGGGNDDLFGGSQADTLIGGPGIDAFAAGDGQDAVRARDGVIEPTIACGAGTGDVASVDTGESANADCESVQTPPETTLLSGPSGTVASSAATFTFSGSANATGFLCALDGAAAAPCSSPVSYSGLADAAHTFSVYARDSLGDAGLAASRTWTVDTTAPETLASGPSGSTTDRTATIQFSSSDSGATFECALDGAAFAACTSPTALSGLGTGAHVFRVRAIDAVGNRDASPAQASWTIIAPPPPDTSAPNTRIQAGPRARTTARRATLRFAATEAPATFQCKLDRGRWSACRSPKTYRSLKKGRHVFQVRALDAAGNVDPTPAKKTWRVT